MRGRQVFMDTLVAHGVEKIFGNPGTTESPLLDSLADYPGIDYVVALQESIAVGAANHYAQASGKTGVVNLHVAPGLGNGIGMIYNAMKANTPLIVTAGQQDTRLRLNEPVLGHDLVAMAAPVTKWSVQAESADELAPILRRAFKLARQAPAGPVFVALPINVMEQETDVPAAGPDPLYQASAPDPAGVKTLAALLAAAEAPVIIAGDEVARARAHGQLLALAECLGADLWHELLHMHAVFPSAHAAGRGSLPSDAAGINKALDGADVVLLVGGAFFEDVWYAPGSYFPDRAKVLQIEAAGASLAHKQALDAGLQGALPASLEAVATTVRAMRGDAGDRAAIARREVQEKQKAAEIAAQQGRAERSWQRRPASMARVMAEIEKARPDGLIIVDETITGGPDLARTLSVGGPGDYYGARGGGIGQGLAGAIGVKIAEPARPVLALSGDGSAMYVIQALWSAAHHNLAIVFVILANQEYRILKHNMDTYRQRFDAASNHAYANMDLSHPILDFVGLAQAMGVEAARIDDPEHLAAALGDAYAANRPYLLEVTIEGKR